MAWAAWAALVSACMGFGPPTLASLDSFGPSWDSSVLQSTSNAPRGPVRAAAAAVIDGATGHVLLSSNADVRLAPASLTKMMTALVATERADLSTVIVATERSMTEPTTIGLGPGEHIRLEDALYGLLLPSGNDAALAIAETVGGGSVDQFVAWMNERAVSLNLQNTQFENPHGLDATGHYSSARDMGELGRVLLGTPSLARIVSTERYTVGNPTLYRFLNSNPLLGVYPGADGVKTGFTDDAGRTFVGSATREGRRLIAVVLNSPDIRFEASLLLDEGFSLGLVGLDIARPGFSAVRVRPPEIGGRLVRLAGWEQPFLRAFGGLEREKSVLIATDRSTVISRWAE